MPRLTVSTPKYRYHRASGQAVVTIAGSDRYLGPYKSRASKIEYDRPLLDPALVEMVKGLGGVSAIAISYPPYYTSMVEWSRAFGDSPIYLHAADRQCVMRPDKSIAFWDGETKPLGDGLTLSRCGGHFDGGTVLHWQGGAGGKGALLTGDIIQSSLTGSASASCTRTPTMSRCRRQWSSGSRNAGQCAASVARSFADQKIARMALPTRITATPPESFANRSSSFSRS